jgi:arylsulfatase A-like enzyme
MRRRHFLAASAALATVGRSSAQTSESIFRDGFEPLRKANILLITADELRFPRHFPPGITDWRAFVQSTMPNLWTIWSRSVNFHAHHTAATACTPARASMMTGLYAHQHFQLITLSPNTAQPGTGLGPELPTAYPTLGKVMNSLGYSSWYFGKWHLSFSGNRSDLDAAGASYTAPYTFPGASYLSAYGFQGGCYPDPDGHTPSSAGEADPFIVDGFINWYATQRPSLTQPWFAVVSLLNPHDAQFFWDGPFDDPTRTTRRDGTGSEWVPDDIAAVPQIYSARAENWQAQPQPNAPAVQRNGLRAQNILTGAIANAGNQFTSQAIVPPLDVPGAPSTYTQAPSSYWTRALDYYSSLMRELDQQLGRVLQTISGSDTVVVFTSDHGEYAGSHGLLGKGFGAYSESTHVPLFVFDPLNQYTRDTSQSRTQLTSSVDLLPLLATIGNRGSTTWINQDPAWTTLYSQRCKLFDILQNPLAAGRDFALHTYDEVFTGTEAFHVVGMRDHTGLYVGYYDWTGTDGPSGAPTTLQFFAASDLLELNNLANSAAATAAGNKLAALLSSELRATMPASMNSARQQMVNRYQNFLNVVLPSNVVQSRAFQQLNW